MNDLNIQRKKIDKIDQELLKLLKERFSAVLRIKKTKKRLKIPITNKKREKKILSKCKTAYQKAIFKKIISESQKTQK